MGDVVSFGGVTSLDLDPDVPLEQAVGKLEDSIVIGWEKEKDGENRFYFASSKANGPEVLWLLELAKQRLLDV